MSVQLSQEEFAQLAQTIEMFEVIAQSQPTDYQSIEILKEAYQKLGRLDDVLRVSKLLADAYCANGQYSAALLECEGILQHQPDCPEIIAIMGEVEARTEQIRALPANLPESLGHGSQTAHEGLLSPVGAVEKTTHSQVAPTPGSRVIPFSMGAGAGDSHGNGHFDESAGALSHLENDLVPLATEQPERSGLTLASQATQASIPINYGETKAPSQSGTLPEGRATPDLIETSATSGGRFGSRVQLDLGDNGNQAFAAFLVNQGLAPGPVVQIALEKVVEATKKNAALQSVGPSLLLTVSREGTINLDRLLSNVMDFTKLGYAPVEFYDIDRQIVRMLPEELTLGRLFLPFDILSRTLLVAVANPFDASGRQAAQQSVDYQIEWYLAAPDKLQNKISYAYGMKPPNA